jgi:two-component system sensor histidine kinase PilS (NtrC family)
MILTAQLKNQEEAHKRFLFLQTARVGIYFLLLALVLLSQFTQNAFTNWDFIFPTYMILIAGFGFHLAMILKIETFMAKSSWMMGSFFLDAILISLLIFFSGIHQTLFLFMYFVNILIAGLILPSKAGVAVALISSIGFTANSIFAPEIKNFSNLFMILLNNISFFSISAVSGYLSEQLDFLGLKWLESSESLKELKNLNTLVLENIPTAVFTTEINGQIVQSNLKAQSIFKNHKISESSSLFDFSEDLKTMAREVLQNHKNQPVLKKEITLFEGEEMRVLAVNASLFWAPDLTHKGYLFIIEDITDFKKMEFSLRQSEKMAAVGQLAAGIAHEIRNPLASISGSIEMLSETSADEDDKKLMRIILKEISRLNNLISEFLDYSKPPVPPQDKLQINGLVAEILESMKLNAQLRQDVSVEIQLKSTQMIKAEKDKLKQAFLNIMINAFQAMEKTSQPKLFVETWDQGSQVVLRIKDSGCGMSEETKKRMFEPFHTTKPKGTGLGLAMTHKIFENHKAHIYVDSGLGIGTDFTIRFPGDTF